MERFLAGVFLALTGSLMLAVAFPPFDLWPLIFVGFVPILLAQHRVMPRRFSGAAYGLGVGGFFAGYFAGIFARGPWYMRWLPVFIAIIAGLAASRDRAFHRRTKYRWFFLQGPFVWVGVEFIRGVIPTIGTWGFLPYALYSQPWLIQPVSIFGIYGLSFLILVVNYALASLALHFFDGRWGVQGGDVPFHISNPLPGLKGVGAILLVWVGASVFLFSHTGSPSSAVLTVAAVHPGSGVTRQEDLDQLLASTWEAIDTGADLVVWHEGALPFDPRERLTDDLQELTASTDTHLVIGYLVKTAGRIRNESVILTPEGEFLGPYGKAHPVAWSGEASVTRGPYEAYLTEIGRLGMIICYDLDFTDASRAVAQSGAQMIAVPSYDWAHIASKHYTHLVFRAVENRVAVVKADVGFDSVLIDPQGRIHKKAVTPQPESALLIADLPLGPQNSFARRWGDWFGWLALAGMVGYAIYDLSGNHPGSWGV